MIKKAMLLLLTTALSGCTTYATGPLFCNPPQTQQGLGRLYIYRVKAPWIQSTFTTPTVKINQKSFIELAVDGYSYIDLKPGIYRLHTGFTSEFAIDEGNEIFIQVVSGGSSLLTVPRAKALADIKNCRYIEPLNTEF